MLRLIGDTPQMRELSVTEQRYQAVLAVISDGETVSSVAARYGVHRKTMHDWLARYEAQGLEGLADRSHRPRSCPHQIDAEVEVAVLHTRLAHPGCGLRLAHGKRAPLQPATADPRPGRTVTGGPHRGRDRRPTDSLKLKCR